MREQTLPDREKYSLGHGHILRGRIDRNFVYKINQKKTREKFGLIYLFNGISTFMGYLMPNPCLSNNSKERKVKKKYIYLSLDRNLLRKIVSVVKWPMF